MKHLIAILALACLLARRVTRGCDLCGCYTPQLIASSVVDPNAALDPHGEGKRSWPDGFYGAVAEQFTHFGTVQLDGREVANPTG